MNVPQIHDDLPSTDFVPAMRAEWLVAENKDIPSTAAEALHIIIMMITKTTTRIFLLNPPERPVGPRKGTAGKGTPPPDGGKGMIAGGCTRTSCIDACLNTLEPGGPWERDALPERHRHAREGMRAVKRFSSTTEARDVIQPERARLNRTE